MTDVLKMLDAMNVSSISLVKMNVCDYSHLLLKNPLPYHEWKRRLQKTSKTLFDCPRILPMPTSHSAARIRCPQFERCCLLTYAYWRNRELGVLLRIGFMSDSCLPQYSGEQPRCRQDRLVVVHHLNLSQSMEMIEE